MVYEKFLPVTHRDEVCLSFPMEIKENEVYTTQEAQDLLKVSSSTMMRLIKKGAIRAAKVGKQYRILGSELLRLVSPPVHSKVRDVYRKGRKWVHEDLDADGNPKPSKDHEIK